MLVVVSGRFAEEIRSVAVAIWYGSPDVPVPPLYLLCRQDQQACGQGQVVELSWPSMLLYTRSSDLEVATPSTPTLRHSLVQADIVDALYDSKSSTTAYSTVVKLHTSPSQVVGVAASLTSLTFQ